MMISVIICSQHNDMDNHLAKNIFETIGAEYEIIHIDNSEGQYNIFQAYNIGVQRAKGKYLCFMHEDVFFHSYGWGQVLIEILSKDTIGILGIAGSHLLLNQLDWRFYDYSCRLIYLMQGNSSVEPHPLYYLEHRGDFDKFPLEKGTEKVAVVDGVWMAMRKDLFNQIRFDDNNFHDFHLYDSDICMQVNHLGLDVMVTDRIVLEHFSEGSFSERFNNSLQVFLKKWSSELPIVRGLEVDESKVVKALESAKKNFDSRLNSDMKKAEIRKLLHMKRDGLPCREFTKEECIVMDRSAYLARKGFIKDKTKTGKQVRQKIVDYKVLPFATHTFKLMWKYVWYRVLHK